MLQVEAGVARHGDDVLAEEVPVAIHYNSVPFAVMMASPDALEDFAIGFSLTECRVAPDDIVAIETSELFEGIVLDVRTREHMHDSDECAHATPASGRAAPGRALPGRSGCGICGNRLLEDVVRQPADVGAGIVIDAQAIESALAAMQSRQPMHAETGAIHAAAWCEADGTLLLVREDVGRHNALDKLIGAMSRAGNDPGNGFALVTSRASYEMATKAAVAGITLLVAMSAPTALAVDLARGCGLTLVGFARPGRHVVYSHPRRLRLTHQG